MLLRQQSQYSPLPQALEEQGHEALWSLELYTTRIQEEQIHHEFVISMKVLNAATVSMGREGG